MLWIRASIALALFLGLLAAGETGYRCLGLDEIVALESLDVQSPNQLIAKLEYLRKFDGHKIVLIGDSIVYGGVLKDYGDEQWRDHTLNALLKDKYAARADGKKVLVMNLGINGALPEDTECITKLVMACKAEVLIFSTHLRPFSADFENDHEAMARPWLRDIVAEDDGSFRYQPASASWKASVNQSVADALRHSRFMQHRDTLHAMIPTAAKSRVETDRILGLYMIKNRFNSVRVDEVHRQMKALRRTLAMMKQQQQKAIYFYVKEHPEDLDSVIDEDSYRRHHSDLARVYQEFAGPNLRVIPAIPELTPRHFLDFSHLNHEGYVILTEHLWSALSAMESRDD